MEQQANEQVSIDGEEITIRALNNQDIELERDFIDKLSPQTKHFRFLGGVDQLSTKQLKELCDIDFDHRMAFIATINADDKEQGVGISRYAQDSEGEGYEFAITVADKWQHKGLGTLLMRKLIEFAKSHQVKRIYSYDLVDNSHMRKLAHDLAMQAKRDPDDARYVTYSLTLD